MSEPTIIFGTDGWRGVISRDVTYDTMAQVADAIGRTAGQGSRIVVGYDTRFLSEEYAHHVASRLAKVGVEVVLSSRYCPSPALSWTVSRQRASLGVMVTASHNPPTYSGIKIKGPEGGPAPRHLVDRVASMSRASYHHLSAVSPGTVARLDFGPGYLAVLRGTVERDYLEALPDKPVVVDSFHGSASGYMSTLLEDLGQEAIEIRGEINPSFGGMSPEPSARSARMLGRSVREKGGLLGLQFDGDGDRLAAWEEPHGFIHPQHVFLLLLEHLVKARGWKGRVVCTSAVTRLVDRLADARGLEVSRQPIGFGNVSREMILGGVLMGGEEAGGFGIGRHIPDRDALLVSLLLLEMIGHTGQPLWRSLESLFSELGRMHFDRVDVPMESMSPDRLEASVRDVPQALAGLRVMAQDRRDGVRLDLEQGAWLLLRASGTEPLVRVYAEAPRQDQLKALLEAGLALFTG